MSRCRSGLRLLGALLVGGALFAGAPSDAQAKFSLTLESGASSLTIVDGDANDVATGVDGVIQFNGPFAGFAVSITTGFSNSGATGVNPVLAIENLTAQGPAGGTLKLTLTDTLFTADSAGPATATDTLAVTQLPTGSATVTYQGFVAGQSAASPLSISGVDGDISAPYVVNIPGSPYVISSVTMITFHTNGILLQASGNTTVDEPQSGPFPTPAPGGVVLIASMLPFAWGLRRRLSRREVAA